MELRHPINFAERQHSQWLSFAHGRKSRVSLRSKNYAASIIRNEKKKIQIEKKNIEKKIQKEKIEMEEDITREVLEEMMPLEDQIVAEILNDVDENRNDTAATSLTNMNMDSEENAELEEENDINAGDPGK